MSALVIAGAIICGMVALVGLVAKPVNAASQIRAIVDVAEPRMPLHLEDIGVIDAPHNVEPSDAVAASLHSRWRQLPDRQIAEKFLLSGHKHLVIAARNNALHQRLYGWFVQVGIIHATEEIELDAMSRGAARVTHSNVRGGRVWKTQDGFWFDGHIGAQLRSRRAPLLDKRPNQHRRPDDSNKQAKESIPGRIAGGIRSLPLGAKIGIAVVFAAFASRVFFDGYLEAGDRGTYRRRGLRKLALGWFLFGLLGAFWWLASSY